MYPPLRLVLLRPLHSSTIPLFSFPSSASLHRSIGSIRLLCMLPRTLRHSRSAPTLRGALSPPHTHPSQAHLHTSSPLKSATPGAPGTPTATKSWREKTVVELRAELKRRGLSTTGRKEDVR